MNEVTLITRIKTRCFWQAVIAPAEFDGKRIEKHSHLRKIVEDSSVSLRGWNYPHVDYDNETIREGADWYGQDLTWGDHLEGWRMYRSGLFASISGLWWDWQGRSAANPEGNGPVTFLPLWDSIYRFTEIYEFASRLAQSEAGSELMTVSVEVRNLEGRTLTQDHPNKTSLRNYTFRAEYYSYPQEESNAIPATALISEPRELAAKGLVDLFDRFGFETSVERIRGWQDELG